jgi:hypothetical protein
LICFGKYHGKPPCFLFSYDGCGIVNFKIFLS